MRYKIVIEYIVPLFHQIKLQYLTGQKIDRSIIQMIIRILDALFLQKQVYEKIG